MGREAVILAGGLGTRLKSLVSDRPKPMAPVNGKPFLQFLLNYLAKNNFNHIILAVGYKHEIIREYFGVNYRNMEISYAVEDAPLGTGGAIKNALTFSKNEYCFILNGDTYFPVSFEKMEQKSCSLVVALRKLDDVARYGTVALSPEGKIIAFEEKKATHSPGLINGGVYLLQKKALTQLNLPVTFSFENDYLVKKTSEQDFYGIVFNNYFIDIGIPETFNQAQSDFFTFE